MSRILTRFVAVATLCTVPLLSSCGLNWFVRLPWPRPSVKDDVMQDKLTNHLRQTKPIKGTDTYVFSGGWETRADIPIVTIGKVVRLEDQEFLLDEVRKWKDTSRFDEAIVKFYGSDASGGGLIRTERVKMIKKD